MKTAERYSLRQVVELTGISEFTLRGWENRYGAFVPDRSKTGRRRYSPAELQKAILLRELVKREHRIGAIAGLSAARLRALLEKSSESPSEEKQIPEVGEAIRHLSVQEWNELECLLEKSARRLGPLAFFRRVLLPLLGEMGELVAAGKMSIAQEHVLSATLKEQMYRLRSRAREPKSRSRFLVAAPEGDFHELGILLAHTLCALHGHRSLYLGPNSPKAELCETALRFGATHILLGSTISKKEGAAEDLFSYVHFLGRHLSPGVTVWVGGRNAAGFGAELERPYQNFRDFSRLEEALEALPTR